MNTTSTVHGEIPVTNLYTAGIALEQFLRTIQRDGKLTATKCESCRVRYVPARLFCERCLARLKTWEDVPAQGTVHTFTVSHLDLDGKRLDRPAVVGLVSFAGFTGGIVHRILGDPSQIQIGMKVEAVFAPAGSRAGSILDIEGFRPTR
ncbi:MAG: Zn-ribbon domain-containing OB-fold protein [Planctomycetes bacterium]|nr:Zn-ribbon domain-containing OB-fold protein [Planctomycetota bacterium]